MPEAIATGYPGQLGQKIPQASFQQLGLSKKIPREVWRVIYELHFLSVLLSVHYFSCIFYV